MKASIELKTQKPASEVKTLLTECATYIVITFVCCIFFAAVIGV